MSLFFKRISTRYIELGFHSTTRSNAYGIIRSGFIGSDCYLLPYKNHFYGNACLLVMGPSDIKVNRHTDKEYEISSFNGHEASETFIKAKDVSQLHFSIDSEQEGKESRCDDFYWSGTVYD